MLRIAEVMKEQGRRKDWLAGKLGVSPSTLSLMLRQERYWNEERKRVAVEALGLESGDGLFEIMDGVDCPLCGGQGKIRLRSRTVHCRFCMGVGQVTQEKLAEVVSVEFLPEGMVV